MIELKLPQNVSVAGATKSGKSTLVMKLLKDHFMKQLDVLIVLSPTIHLSGDFSEFKDNEDPNKGKVIYKFKDKFKQVIEETIEQQEALFEHHSKKDIPQIMIILDDMVGHSLLRYRGLIDKLSTKSRHLNISLVVLVQRITAIPRTFRLNTQTFILFNVVNFSELERILEDCIPKKLRNPLRLKITEIYNEAYNYLQINCFANKIKDRLWKNGTEPLYDFLLNTEQK